MFHVKHQAGANNIGIHRKDILRCYTLYIIRKDTEIQLL